MQILSLGAGVQSTAMLYMAIDGTLPRPDCVIFADTKWEPKAVYKNLKRLRAAAAKADLDLYVVTHSNIRSDLVSAAVTGKRIASPPYRTLNPQGSRGKLRRQCTHEYKLKPMWDLATVLRRGRAVDFWIGITTDEADRIKPKPKDAPGWLTNVFPLIGLEMSREACRAWLKEKGHPEPPRSACIGCPFHGNEFWRNLKMNSPKEWQDVVDIDRMVRDKMPHLRDSAYTHRDLVALDEAEIRNMEDLGQLDLFKERESFSEECEGACGT